jgi:hypothetical protein
MKFVGIYSGNFQPPHKGNYITYKKLSKITGTDTFIATTGRVNIPNDPLNFGDKVQIWVRHGVPANKIIKVENIFKPLEITHLYDPSTTIAIFILNQKDLQKVVGKTSNDPITGKPIYLQRSGNNLSYFQPYETNKETLKPLNQNGYVIIMDDNSIDGRFINGPSIRKGLGSPRFTQNDKILFFKWAFGWYDPSLFDLIKEKYTSAQKSVPEKNNNNDNKETIKELLNTPQGNTGELDNNTITTTTTTTDDTTISAADRSKELQNNRIAAQKAKAELERNLDSQKKKLKLYQQSAKVLQRDVLPGLVKQGQEINKDISTGSPVVPSTVSTSI